MPRVTTTSREGIKVNQCWHANGCHYWFDAINVTVTGNGLLATGSYVIRCRRHVEALRCQCHGVRYQNGDGARYDGDVVGE